jgi:hypothetical protein
VIDPTTTATDEASASPQPPVRRSRNRWQLAVGLLAIVGVAFASSACTPEAVAKQAIQNHFDRLAPCAERIAKRESNFQADAVNRSSGTVGLFQIHPTHANWVKSRFGYSMEDLKDPNKNAQVAKALQDEAYRYYKDGWQPWRYNGAVAPGGGCPA